MSLTTDTTYKNLPEFIKKAIDKEIKLATEEEFDDKFDKPLREDLPMLRQLDRDGKLFLDHSPIKQWHTNSLHALLDAVIEVEETKKFKTPDNPLAQYAEREKMGYNQAKQDTITTLQAIKKLL